jgi:uncharacterized membrane protein (DUF485 family)
LKFAICLGLVSFANAILAAFFLASVTKNLSVGLGLMLGWWLVILVFYLGRWHRGYD